MTVDLTNEEAQALVSLIDLAVKAGGLQAAQAAVPLFQKLQAAANPPAVDSPPAS